MVMLVQLLRRYQSFLLIPEGLVPYFLLILKGLDPNFLLSPEDQGPYFLLTSLRSVLQVHLEKT